MPLGPACPPGPWPLRDLIAKLLIAFFGCEMPLQRLMGCAYECRKRFSQFATILSFFFFLNLKIRKFQRVYVYIFFSLFSFFSLITNAYLLLLLGLLKFASN